MKMNELPLAPLEPLPTLAAAPEVYQQLGQITRQLHDALQPLGVMRQLQQSAQNLPEARSRLGPIARQSGEAADRVLTAVEQARHEQRAIQAATRQLAQRCGADPARLLPAAAVLALAVAVEGAAARIDQQLTDILRVQDFHDLTGQVTAQVVARVIDLEDRLLKLLMQAAAAEAAPAADGVSDQGEVDELLARLGF